MNIINCLFFIDNRHLISLWLHDGKRYTCKSWPWVYDDDRLGKMGIWIMFRV